MSTSRVLLLCYPNYKGAPSHEVPSIEYLYQAFNVVLNSWRQPVRRMY